MKMTFSFIAAAVLGVGVALYSLSCGGGGGGGTGLGLLLFAGNDGAGGTSYNNNYELWSFDGNAASKVAEINSTYFGSHPREFIEHGDVVLFNANDGIHGRELWATDGQSAWMVTAISQSETLSLSNEQVVPLLVFGANPRNFTSFGAEVYFITNEGRDSGLYATDGTGAGTYQVVRDVAPVEVYSVNDLEVFKGDLVFSGASWSSGPGIYATDGSADAETLIVAGFTSVGDIAAMGGTLYFNADDGVRGFELWATDGTAEGTTLVKDINPTTGSSPNYMTPLDGTLYFRAYTGSEGYELWSTDGTAQGTTLHDLVPGAGSSYPIFLTTWNGKLYFSAQHVTDGQEVWWADSEGAQILTDINVGGSSYPDFFVPYKERLYFNALTTTYGNELWSTDGTPAGTAIEEDIWPGDGSGVLQMIDN